MCDVVTLVITASGGIGFGAITGGYIVYDYFTPDDDPTEMLDEMIADLDEGEE